MPASPTVAPPADTSLQPRRRLLSGDTAMYVLLVVLTLSAWQLSRLGLFKAGDDISYWIAVAGGICMLLLLSYPLRKYVRFMQRWGRVKWWFWTHMALGIAGPWLILVHSTFRVGSVNAGVALYSMIIVVLSGVIGRFIYVRVHRGLHGEQTSLQELQTKAGFVETEARSRLHFAPAVEARLLAFAECELVSRPGWWTHLRQVSVLPLQQWTTYRACVRDLKAPLQAAATKQQWPAEVLARRERLSRNLVHRYLNAVVRVAQFTAYERVFALWHIAHLPFVYLLVFSAVVHVIAVHAY